MGHAVTDAELRAVMLETATRIGDESLAAQVMAASDLRAMADRVSSACVQHSLRLANRHSIKSNSCPALPANCLFT